jgi:hypothetical protein
MSALRIAILRALTSILNSAASWAGSNPDSVVQLFLMIAAAGVVAVAVAMFYIIHLLS